jgi:hypothetical protein
MAREEAARLVGVVSEGRPAAAEAMERLAALGADAVDAALDAFEGKAGSPPASRHPRDWLDDLSGVLQGVAATDPEPLIEALDRRPEHATSLVWALGAASTERAVDALVGALEHRSADVRWAAAAALERRPSPRARDALITRLRDRSSRVRFAALLALEPIADEHALPALRRFLAARRLAIGERRVAEAMLARLEPR